MLRFWKVFSIFVFSAVLLAGCAQQAVVDLYASQNLTYAEVTNNSPVKSGHGRLVVYVPQLKVVDDINAGTVLFGGAGIGGRGLEVAGRGYVEILDNFFGYIDLPPGNHVIRYQTARRKIDRTTVAVRRGQVTYLWMHNKLPQQKVVASQQATRDLVGMKNIYRGSDAIDSPNCQKGFTKVKCPAPKFYDSQ